MELISDRDTPKDMSTLYTIHWHNLVDGYEPMKRPKRKQEGLPKEEAQAKMVAHKAWMLKVHNRNVDYWLEKK